jgi:hypothetical protein
MGLGLRLVGVRGRADCAAGASRWCVGPLGDSHAPPGDENAREIGHDRLRTPRGWAARLDGLTIQLRAVCSRGRAGNLLPDLERVGNKLPTTQRSAIGSGPAGHSVVTSGRRTNDTGQHQSTRALGKRAGHVDCGGSRATSRHRSATTGGQGVAGSNPVSPTSRNRRSEPVRKGRLSSFSGAVVATGLLPSDCSDAGELRTRATPREKSTAQPSTSSGN